MVCLLLLKKYSVKNGTQYNVTYTICHRPNLCATSEALQIWTEPIISANVTVQSSEDAMLISVPSFGDYQDG